MHTVGAQAPLGLLGRGMEDAARLEDRLVEAMLRSREHVELRQRDDVGTEVHVSHGKPGGKLRQR